MKKEKKKQKNSYSVFGLLKHLEKMDKICFTEMLFLFQSDHK